MSDLLPCPFCGHTGLSFEDGSTHRWGIASCDECGATTGEVRRNYPDDGEWHAEAIKEWNRRAQPAITSESGKNASQGASAITSAGVPRLTDEEIHEIYDEVAKREPYSVAVTRRNVVRAIEAALIAKWSKT